MEDNKLIAEFMGLKEIKAPVSSGKMWLDTDNRKHLKLKYNSSWNWLMLVVEKIETLAHVVIDESDCKISTSWAGEDSESIYDTYNYTFMENSKIASVYNGVVHFIKWYKKHG